MDGRARSHCLWAEKGNSAHRIGRENVPHVGDIKSLAWV